MADDASPGGRVCMGGTFHPFHVGHEALLRAAARDAEALFVGITDGALAARADRDVPGWEERAVVVRDFLRRQGFEGDLVVRALADAIGPAASEPYDRIVVSPQSKRGAETINKTRADAGLPALEVRVVPHVLADDLLPVSGTRIATGDIDRSGQRLTPVRVAVGSENPIKVAGAGVGVGRVLRHVELDVRPFDVHSEVPEQPKEDETLAGARARAKAAAEAWPEADYAVGIEAGLNQDPAGDAWYDAQAVVVRDRDGRDTDGWGPAFQYPEWVTRLALEGIMISDILGPVAGDPQIGGTTGAIGYLTDGAMDRTELTSIGVLMAMLPRVRRHLYDVRGPPAGT